MAAFFVCAGLGLLQQAKHSDSVSRSYVHLAVRDHRGDEFVSCTKLISSA